MCIIGNSKYYTWIITNTITVTVTLCRGRRTCRFGAGTEKTKNCCDTGGFPLHDEAQFRNVNGSEKFCMPRKDSRTLQSSLDMLQSWRANCDLQFLLYNSDPLDVDPVEG